MRRRHSCLARDAIVQHRYARHERLRTALPLLCALVACAPRVVPAPPVPQPAPPVDVAPAPSVPVAEPVAVPPPLLPPPPPSGAAGPMIGPAAISAAMDALRQMREWTLEQQISICEIPAPPFKESARAAEFARRLEQIGLQNVRTDPEGNVIGEYPRSELVTYPESAGDGVIALAAHLDTVFPEGTDVTVRRSGDTLRGPGIGDNCRGLAVLLSIARALQESGVQPFKTILFIGTVGEEGPGNLRGVRHLFDSELGQRIEYFVAVDNAGAELATRAVGSNRYRVRFIGPGGHSYGAFGMPNPAHALGRAVARIADIQVPARPKATFNVGVMGGGTSVNSITAEAWFEMDLRSESPEVLNALDAAFNRAVQGAVAAERARWPRSNVPLEVKIDTIGIRPAGSQRDTAAIVNVAIMTARALGFTPRIEASSTDANIPLSRGIPAIRISGGGIGRDSHSLNEYYIDGEHPYLGPQWALMIALALSGVM